MTRAVDDQLLQDLVSDGQGGAFLVWYDWPTYDVYAQHVLGDGQIAPGWPADGLPVSVRPGFQLFPRLIADGAGGIFVIWQDGEFDVPGDIYAQHLNGDGTRVAGWPEGGLGLCTDPGSQGNPHFASDGTGGFIATWGDLRGGGTFAPKIYGTRVSWSGEFAPGWPANGLQIIGWEGGHGIRHMVPDGSGGVYIGWQHNHGPGADDDDVYAVRVLGDGTIAPGWPSGGYPVTTRSDNQFLTSMVADGAGGVLLAWYDNLELPAVALVQRLDPGGMPALGWPADGVRASDIVGFHFSPKLAPNGHGGAFVVLEIQTGSNEGFIQHLSVDGGRAPGWPSSAVALVNDPTGSSSQGELAVAPDGVGGAIVAWNDFRNGRQDQIYAQRFFGDGPTPALVSLARVEALPDRVTLAWYDAGRTLSDATVHRRRDGEDWAALGRVSFDGSGRLEYEDRGVAPGARYAYRLAWVESGGEQLSAETWVDVPLALTLALEGARPNPAFGPLTVAFTLPHAGTATLELLDVAGRRVVARDVGSLGAGQHVIRLGECACTPPGMYWLRLTQSGRSHLKRAVIVG